MKTNEIYLGDCLEIMPNFPDKIFDAIICDLPYGVTKNKIDFVIDLEELWKNYKRIIKTNGVIILFGQDKFTAKVMLSNEKWHRYNLIWNKVLTSGFLNANRMPLRVHEDIMIFYNKPPTYNPQKVKGKPNHSKGKNKDNKNTNYGYHNFVDNTDILGDMKHPQSILTFQKPHPSTAIHPTQKSLELLEWLVKSYTNEGDLVLDNCAGSGTTGLACKNLNRNYILIEKEKEFYDVCLKRLNLEE